jgi:hypothetical protein
MRNKAISFLLRFDIRTISVLCMKQNDNATFYTNLFRMQKQNHTETSPQKSFIQGKYIPILSFYVVSVEIS